MLKAEWIQKYFRMHLKSRSTLNWALNALPIRPEAYYFRADNSINLSAFLIQSMASQPKILAYGSLGLVIGHEIAHAFSGWKEQYKGKALKQFECVVDQYSKYIEPTTKIQLNGAETVYENIADIFGAKQAYKAHLEENGLGIGTDVFQIKPFTLPGLRYSQNQLFWISYGQSFCQKITKEAIKKLLFT
jgi:predicted metalloendopeptidase